MRQVLLVKCNSMSFFYIKKIIFQLYSPSAY